MGERVRWTVADAPFYCLMHQYGRVPPSWAVVHVPGKGGLCAACVRAAYRALERHEAKETTRREVVRSTPAAPRAVGVQQTSRRSAGLPIPRKTGAARGKP